MRYEVIEIRPHLYVARVEVSSVWRRWRYVRDTDGLKMWYSSIDSATSDALRLIQHIHHKPRVVTAGAA